MKKLFTIMMLIAVAACAPAYAQSNFETAHPGSIGDQSYNWCTTLQDFANRIKFSKGVRLSYGKSPIGEYSVIMFNDDSFGVYFYDGENLVCIGSTGEFHTLMEIPGTDS